MNHAQITSLLDTIKAGSLATATLYADIDKIQRLTESIKSSRQPDVQFVRKWLGDEVMYGNSMHGSSPFCAYYWTLHITDVDMSPDGLLLVTLEDRDHENSDDYTQRSWGVPLRWFAMTDAELTEAINQWLSMVVEVAREAQKAKESVAEQANRARQATVEEEERAQLAKLKAKYESN